MVFLLLAWLVMYYYAHVRAQKIGGTADTLMRDSQASSLYWDGIQDGMADLARVMLSRCFDADGYPELSKHCTSLRGQLWMVAFPNVFITIAPAEWKFWQSAFFASYSKHNVAAGAFLGALHMYFVVMSRSAGLRRTRLFHLWAHEPEGMWSGVFLPCRTSSDHFSGQA